MTELRQKYPTDELELGQRTGHLIWRAQQHAWRVFMEEAEKHDITPVQASVLLVISNQPGIDQKTLAGIIALDKATTGNVLGRLEARGLLIRKIEPTDRRARALYLTTSGRALNRKMGTVIRRARERLVEKLTRQERLEFIRLLRKFIGLQSK
jgi:DNA-binding MarR family transcriptional regulator